MHRSFRSPSLIIYCLCLTVLLIIKTQPLSVPFLGIGKLGGRLERHQLEGAPMSTRTATTFEQGCDQEWYGHPEI